MLCRLLQRGWIVHSRLEACTMLYTFSGEIYGVLFVVNPERQYRMADHSVSVSCDSVFSNLDFPEVGLEFDFLTGSSMTEKLIALKFAGLFRVLSKPWSSYEFESACCSYGCFFQSGLKVKDGFW